MTELFLKILNMSIAASWLVLAVLLLRLVLAKAPKWIAVLLWGVVAVRLICPFNFESVLSLIPSAETISPQVAINPPAIDSGISVIDNVINPIIGTTTITLQPEKEVNLFQAIIPYLAGMWYAGMAALLIYTAISFLRVKHKIGTAVLLKGNIYQSENVISPFVLGIVKPKIYLPFNMNDQDTEYVIAHEQTHINRRDHLWKPLGFFILTIHWFNPLMWLCYLLLCRDIELACDEKVVKDFNKEHKADYSQALLNCSVNRHMIAACPIAFGEVSVKKRVKSVLNYRKPAFWVIVIAVTASIFVAFCFLTNPKTSVNEELSLFIDTQIADRNYSERHTDDNFIAVHHKVLGVDKSINKTTVYMWAMYNEYSEKNGEIIGESGSYVPTVITAKRTGSHGHYELIEYWEPRDGSYYAKDIKEKFPWYLHRKALDSQRYVDEQTEFCENSAKEYFSSVSYVVPDDIKNFESTISYANWSDSNEIYLRALNTNTMLIGNVLHLPIYKFDKLSDLESFKRIFEKIYTMDSSWDESPSFNDATAKYDNSFFEENSLILVYVGADNNTNRFKLHSVDYDKESFTAHIVETTNAEVVDSLMSGWFITVAVSDEMIKSCSVFDADLNNVIEQLDQTTKTDNPPTLQHYPAYISLYEETPADEIKEKYDAGEFVITKLHYQAIDGQWACENYKYKYRLEVDGRPSNADKKTTFVVLSNSNEITFEQALKSTISSNTEDYFKPSEAVIVATKLSE